MSLLLSVHSASTWALVGLIWTIQCVHYPLFALVGPENFTSYHQRHSTQITWVVAPLMLMELGSAAWLVLAGARDPWLLLSLIPLAVNWLSTWRLQIPLHDRLAGGFEAQVHRRLVQSNWVRTVSWTMRGIFLLMVTG